MVEDPLSEMILYKQFHAGEIIVVDTEDDPDSPGEQRIAFTSVEGFVPPSSVELATTATAAPTVESPETAAAPPPNE
jgi:ATP-dependent Clp protease ATP-binding subunit ClpC